MIEVAQKILTPLALDASLPRTSSKHVGGVIDYFLKPYRKPRKTYTRRTQEQELEDFLSRLDRSAGSAGCWVWKRGTTHGGYGEARYLGKNHKTHRLVWLLTTGPIPPELELCHTCDNPRCCNPNHLFAGTHLWNMQDMHKKGRNRQPKGERSAWAKLNSEKVILLRKLYAVGNISFRLLGQEFGISKSAARHIVQGKKWKHLPLEPVRTRLYHENRRLNYDRVQQLRVDYATHLYTVMELGEKYGIHHSTVVNICKGRSWKKNIPVDEIRSM